MAISDVDYADDSDLALIRRTRAGDMDAYARLHQRHVGSARALSWRMSRSPSDADDLVSEGFARVLSALQRGRGPDTAFRPYLLSTIRRLAYDRTEREQREAPVAYDLEATAAPLGDPVVAGFETDAAADAFASLPERWRLVLWHTEVEGQRPAEVAVLLGMSPNAVAALAYRAREGLRQAYLANHASSRPDRDRECRFAADRMAAYIRGGLTAAQEARVAAHLERCDSCQAAYLALLEENTAMRSLVALAVLGPFAGGYLAEIAKGAGRLGWRAHGGRRVARAGAAHRGGRLAAGVASRARVATVVLAGLALVGLAAFFSLRSGSSPDAIRLSKERIDHSSTTGAVPSDTKVDSRTDVSSPGTPSSPGTSTPIDPGVGTTDPGSSPADPASGSPGSSGTDAPSVPTGPSVIGVGPRPNPPTTVPPSIPTTTLPEDPDPPVKPNVPVRLDVAVSSAGPLVAGRPGVLVVAVDQTSGAAAAGSAVDVTLTSASLRGGPEQIGWTCSPRSSTTVHCTGPAMGPERHTAMYLPVSVDAGASTVTTSATVATTGTSAKAAPEVRTASIDVAAHGMAARFATVDHGDVATTGNSLLTCDASDAGCAAGRAGTGSRVNDDDFAMVPVDTDGDPATATSSSAQLAIPTGARVLSAQLYYGADRAAGADGSPAPNAATVGTAVLTSPRGARTTTTAERIDEVGSRYQAVVDVTAAVRAGGGGRWTVGGVQAATGHGTYAGWSLIVAYRLPSAPLRSLVVLDGLSQVAVNQSVRLHVGGFLVPSGGSRAATISLVSYEGDAGLTGDQMTVGDHALSDGCNPLGNTFDASACDLGRPSPARTPGDTNLFGFDVDRLGLDGVLAPGSTETDIDLDTASDVYLPGALAFTVDQ